MNLQQRAKRAAQILDDDVFKEAVEALDQEILRQFKACQPEETEVLAEIKRKQASLVQLVKHFETALKTGMMEEGKLVELKKRRTWQKLMSR